MFINNHKRAIGLCVGGLGLLAYLVGLCIPGVNVLEIGWLSSLIIGVVGVGGTGIFVSKKGWESTMDKIKNKKIRPIEDLKNNDI